jgi:hypothetical protein
MMLSIWPKVQCVFFISSFWNSIHPWPLGVKACLSSVSLITNFILFFKNSRSNTACIYIHTHTPEYQIVLSTRPIPAEPETARRSRLNKDSGSKCTARRSWGLMVQNSIRIHIFPSPSAPHRLHRQGLRRYLYSAQSDLHPADTSAGGEAPSPSWRPEEGSTIKRCKTSQDDPVRQHELCSPDAGSSSS